VTDADYEKLYRFIVLEPVKARLAVLFRFKFRTAADDILFRLRAPLPRNLLIIFCVEAATCSEIVCGLCRWILCNISNNITTCA
jgi:hypothetical protein